MKKAWVVFMLLCSGCAALTADPWSWMDDPAEQSWVDVRIEGYGREITFSIPDRLQSGGQRPHVWPPPAPGRREQGVRVSPDVLKEPSHTLAQYIWDRWWGGVLQGKGHDFSLNVRVIRQEGRLDLLDMSIAQRISRRIEYRKNLYLESDGSMSRLGEFFFEQFWIKQFKSEQHDFWLVENGPIVTADHVYYSIPITGRHILEFSFFVRDKRYGNRDEPDWNASRWSLVEKIMNTVRITPDPFPESAD